MKKTISLFLTVVLLLSLVVPVAMAAPALITENCNCGTTTDEHDKSCLSRCRCNESGVIPEEYSHVATCDLYKCIYCGVYINQHEEHKIDCHSFCKCGFPENEHTPDCKIYKCGYCSIYPNQGEAHTHYTCPDFACPKCDKLFHKEGPTEGCLCYYYLLVESMGNEDAAVDEDIYEIAFVDKSQETITLFNEENVGTFGTEDNCYKKLNSTEWPDVLIVRHRYRVGSEPKYYQITSFDVDFYDTYAACYPFVEDKHFTTVRNAAGLYATFAPVYGGDSIVLYNEYGEYEEVEASLLAGEYVVAEYDGDFWQFKLIPSEDWPVDAAYCWIDADNLLTLSVDPTQIPCEYCGVTGNHAIGCFATFTQINQTAVFAEYPVTLYYNPVTEPENCKSFEASDFGENFEFTVQYSFPGENDVVWYMLDTRNWEIFADADTCFSYVLSNNVTFKDKEEDSSVVSSCTTVVNGVSIAVEGRMPSGSTVTASAYAVTNPGTFGLTDASGIKAAYDIKILDANGDAIQPEGYVFVVMNAAAMGLSNGAVVELIHQHGSAITTSTHVVTNGKLIFPVSGFSVFIVNSTNDTTGTEITGNSADNPYVMTVGESKIFFDSNGGGAASYTVVNTTVQAMYNSNSTYYYYVDGEYKEVTISRSGSWNNYRYTISVDGQPIDGYENIRSKNTTDFYIKQQGTTAYRGEWQVTDESNAIYYEITSVNYEGYQHMAPYIEVTAKDAGDVILTYKYVSGNSIREETLYIKVVAPTGNELYVDDQVAEIGCIVPAGLENVDGVTYTWIRSDGQVIRSEALNDDGTVNVSLDRGGLTEGRDPITYTVTATLADGTTLTASYEVLYSNEILNTSFETPDLGKEEGVGGNHYLYNGYPGLYWKTTAPGSTTGQLTQDIELIQEGTGALGAYGVQYAAHGSQFVELNAENFGALYQDILTTPGANLSWTFSHNGRTTSGSNNTMYVVVAATENASSIASESEIDALLDQVSGATIPSSGPGYSLTYNGATYYIWKHVADNNANTWETISGSYTVPEGQYLTRLFFASETNTGSSKASTMGNLIDAVSAGETMSYKIEYYVDGSLVTGNTQTGNATVYTAVDLEHLPGYIADGYVLTAAKIQLETGDVEYPGNVDNGLYITGYGDSGDDDYAVILKVYLAKRAVTITKNIVIEGWDDMTDDEKKALIGSGLTAEFELKSTGKIYTASLTIIAVSSTGELTAMGEFLDSTGEAPANGTYTVSETSAPTISGYSCSTAFDKTSITITDTNPTNAIVCTNNYAAVPVTINYEVVGPTGCGTVNPTSETVKIASEDAKGSTATAKSNVYKFVGWYDNEKCEGDPISTNAQFVPEKVNGKNVAATYYAKFEYNLTSMTITKALKTDMDANQAFIFRVKGPGLDTYVTIYGPGSITIDGLTVGCEYSVTEQLDWAWRYTVAPSVEQVITLAPSGNALTFTNSRGNDNWLSGDSYAINLQGASATLSGN